MSQLGMLSDYEFELLVADLLTARDGRTFSTFPRGADGGIDVRSRLDTGWHIVQCKHYWQSDVPRVVRAAAKELNHLKAIKPAEYTFVTSRRLTATAKDKVVAAAAPFIRGPENVLAEQDLLALLRRFPEVERQHVKLWLGSGAQLERLLQNETYERTAGLLEVLMQTLPRYVQTKAFWNAKTILDEHRVVIVAGPPGVGKTTVANLLMLDYAERGFRPYVIQADPAEGFSLLKDDEPQVLFFDDFLGRVSLFDSVKDDPRDLTNLIQRIRGREETRLILSTREYIYQQAQQSREELQWHRLEAEKYSLTLESYSRTERALIFYNHLSTSPDVPRAAKNQLLEDGAYFRVIDHSGYNPRLIEWMTGLSGQVLNAAQLSNYPRYCVGVLDHPEQLWSFAFDQGISYGAQLILYALAGLPTVCRLRDLESSASAIWRAAGQQAGHRRITDAVRELHDSFIRSTRARTDGDPDTAIQVLNPSLIDFLQRRLVDDSESISALLSGAPFFDQVRWAIDRLLEHGPIDDYLNNMVEAVERTITSAAPRSWNGYLFRPGSVTPQSSLERLAVLASWLRTRRALRAPLRALADTLFVDVVSSVETASAARCQLLIPLIEALRIPGYDSGVLAVAIKERLDQLPPSLSLYEAIRELRTASRVMFNVHEWAQVGDEFAQWQRDAFEDPDGYFDDVDELGRAADLADDFGRPYDDDDFEGARQHMEESRSEAAERAMEQVDPDDVLEDHDDAELPNDDSDYIDAIFDGLRT
jgi:hypothetical protein